MKEVMLVTGAGQISKAVARRVGYGKNIVLGDKGFITGSTFLCDGGATSSFFYGDLKPTE